MGSINSTQQGTFQPRPADNVGTIGEPFTALEDSLRAPAAVAKKRPGRFVVATAEHDAALRTLLRDNPMPGPIQVSLEREPNYFAGAAHDGTGSATIIALENGRAVCSGAASGRIRYLNGSATLIGYLSGLRLDNAHRGKASILLRAYKAFRDLHRAHANPPKVYLSSVLSQNLPAVRFVERNLPEMPTYTRIGQLIALMIRPTPRSVSLPAGTTIRSATDADFPTIAEFLNEQNQHYQFAPVWSAQTLQACIGLAASDFQLLHGSANNLLACGAIWDQRPFRQNVIRGYSPRLRKLRPLLNLGARLIGRPILPEIGHVIPLAFASHLAATTPASLLAMLQSLRRTAFDRKLQFLTTSFDASDPRLPAIRAQFRPREYPSNIYVVRWEDGNEVAKSLDTRLLNPDVSLL